MKRTLGWMFLVACVFGPGTARSAAADAAAAPATDDPPPASREDRQEPGEVPREMQSRFVTRLQVELALTDEQMTTLTPEIESLEETRLRNQEERRQLGVELRRALEGGAGDDEIQGVLDRFDEASIRHETVLRERLRKIDASLTVRQRAELRLFLARIRQDVEHRARDFRQNGRRPTRR